MLSTQGPAGATDISVPPRKPASQIIQTLTKGEEAAIFATLTRNQVSLANRENGFRMDTERRDKVNRGKKGGMSNELCLHTRCSGAALPRTSSRPVICPRCGVRSI